MDKQEEIRKGIIDRLVFSTSLSRYGAGIEADFILRKQASQGAVIKVEKELPVNPCEKCELDLSRECHNVCMERTQYEIAVKMLKAGFVAVEPLIKE